MTIDLNKLKELAQAVRGTVDHPARDAEWTAFRYAACPTTILALIAQLEQLQADLRSARTDYRLLKIDHEHTKRNFEQADKCAHEREGQILELLSEAERLRALLPAPASSADTPTGTPASSEQKCDCCETTPEQTAVDQHDNCKFCDHHYTKHKFPPSRNHACHALRCANQECRMQGSLICKGEYNAQPFGGEGCGTLLGKNDRDHNEWCGHPAACHALGKPTGTGDTDQ